MSATDKIKNAAQDVKGKVKEATGKVTDDEQLEAEGTADQAASSAKKAGEKRQGRRQERRGLNPVPEQGRCRRIDRRHRPAAALREVTAAWIRGSTA